MVKQALIGLITLVGIRYASPLANCQIYAKLGTELAIDIDHGSSFSVIPPIYQQLDDFYPLVSSGLQSDSQINAGNILSRSRARRETAAWFRACYPTKHAYGKQITIKSKKKYRRTFADTSLYIIGGWPIPSLCSCIFNKGPTNLWCKLSLLLARLPSSGPLNLCEVLHCRSMYPNKPANWSRLVVGCSSFCWDNGNGDWDLTGTWLKDPQILPAAGLRVFALLNLPFIATAFPRYVSLGQCSWDVIRVLYWRSFKSCCNDARIKSSCRKATNFGPCI